MGQVKIWCGPKLHETQPNGLHFLSWAKNIDIHGCIYRRGTLLHFQRQSHASAFTSIPLQWARQVPS